MILVVGATGILGGRITRRLLEQRRDVCILVRPASEYQDLERAGAAVRFGDLRDARSLEAALEGVEVVVTTANSVLRSGADTLQGVDVEGNRNLIDAARSAGARQFVFVSALGASLDHPLPFMQAKAMTEEYLRASRVPYTILAPNVFMEGWIGMIVGMPLESGQPVTLVREGRRRHSFVSMEDVAAVTVAAVGNPAAENQYIPVAGPVAASWRDIVDSCSRTLGREVPVRWVDSGDSLPGLPEQVSQLMASFELYDTEVDTSEIAQRFGVALTPVEAFVRRAFAPVP